MQIYSSRDGPYLKSTSQDKVSGESLIQLPEGGRDVKEAVNGTDALGQGGCKEEMPQSRWGHHSIFSLDCISRSVILTFPNAEDPSSSLLLHTLQASETIFFLDLVEK